MSGACAQFSHVLPGGLGEVSRAVTKRGKLSYSQTHKGTSTNLKLGLATPWPQAMRRGREGKCSSKVFPCHDTTIYLCFPKSTMDFHRSVSMNRIRRCKWSPQTRPDSSLQVWGGGRDCRRVSLKMTWKVFRPPSALQSLFKFVSFSVRSFSPFFISGQLFSFFAHQPRQIDNNIVCSFTFRVFVVGVCDM